MHSSLVGALKPVLVSSAYFGFTNSGTPPYVRVRVTKYSSNEYKSVFVFPGKGENPAFSGDPSPKVEFGTSPLACHPESFSKASI